MMKRTPAFRRLPEVFDESLDVVLQRAKAQLEEQAKQADAEGHDHTRTLLFTVTPSGQVQVDVSFQVFRRPKQLKPACGAKCRTGKTCRAKVCARADGSLAKRCRMHGGLSTGPKSVEGRAAIGQSNKTRKQKKRNSEETS